MARKLLYQTLRDKGNPDIVRRDGPYPCNWDNSWLGEGYYYWDTFINNAHWWGVNGHGTKYFICEAYCDYDTDKCLDLVGTTEHLLQFSNAVDLMKSKKLVNNKTTVSRILNYMKHTIKVLKHEAVRAYGIHTISQNNPDYDEFNFKLVFEIGKPQYLDYKPAIQICIFNKFGLGLNNYNLIYPYEYNEDYMA